MFYTYVWYREDGTPYYVGKGIGTRAFDSEKRHKPPKDRSRITLQFWSDESTAFAFERYLIDFWGRIDLGTGCLRNRTDGGTGGLTLTPEQCRQRSERLKGQPNGQLGRKRSAEARERMRLAQLGSKASQETRQKMSRAHLGKPMSEAARANMKASQSTEEARKSKSLARKGKPWTLAQRANYTPKVIVSWYKPYGKWRARAPRSGKHLGYFLTRAAAEQVQFQA